MREIYKNYLRLRKITGILLVVFHAFLIFFLLYLLQFSLPIKMHFPGILGDMVVYLTLIVFIAVFLAYMPISAKLGRLEEEWCLKSYYAENLTFGAGMVILLATGFVLVGFALAEIMKTGNAGMIGSTFLALGLVPIAGFLAILNRMRGRFFITKRFAVKIELEGIAKRLKSSGLNCESSRYFGLKCGKMRIGITRGSDAWKNREFWMITIEGITEENAEVARKIIREIDEYAKARGNQISSSSAMGA